MQSRNILDYIKAEYKTGGMIKKIILVNAFVFLFFLVLRIVSTLFVADGLLSGAVSLFAMPGKFGDMIYKPWTIITSLFTHIELGHFFINLLMFYFTSKLFVQFFGEKRLLSTYILGGVFASFVHCLAYVSFPYFADKSPGILMGASGAVNALIGALVFYKPQLKVKLFFMIEVPFWVLGVLFIIGDLFKLTDLDGVAHFAHLGGALFGVLSVMNVNSPNNFMNKIDNLFSNKISFKRKPKMKVYRNAYANKMTDEQYNSNKVNKQKQMDVILDKISANGYESLSKKEKDFLFKFGNE